jgi:hypothetical protein
MGVSLPLLGSLTDLALIPRSWQPPLLTAPISIVKSLTAAAALPHCYRRMMVH